MVKAAGQGRNLQKWGGFVGAYETKPSMKNAAGLRVFAPSRGNTSKPVRKPFVKKPASKQDESLPKSDSESQPAFEIQTKSKKRNNDSARPILLQARSETQLPAKAVVTEPDSDPNFTFAALFAFLPSWLVSMVFHLTLLIALAILTLSSTEKKTVVLEIAEASEPLSEVFEVLILEEEMEEEVVETEEEFSEGPITPMDPILSAEMVDQFELGDDNFANNDVPGGEALAEAQPPSGETDGEKTPKKTAQFFGIESEGNRFVFVIDASGSMAQEYRWTLAIEELRKSIEELEYSQEFVIYLYNHQTWAMLGAKPGTAKYLEANEENKARVYSWLDRAVPFGDTRPAFSMRLALNHKPDAIFLLSDGELRDNTVGQLQTWNLSGRYGGIPINTVFLGNGMGGLTMKTIAEQNNGVFKAVR